MIFTSTTGRSGTRYLANIVNTNSLNATAEHDPYPRGYGNPIKWYDNGENEKLKRLVMRKLRRLEIEKNSRYIINKPIIRGMTGRGGFQTKIYVPFYNIFRNYIPSVEIKEIYLESTHAFLKSYGETMFSILPNIGIIHLTRDPIEVAKSFFNRNSIPGPNNPFLLDPNFKKNIIKPSIEMTNFQKCLWYWFESEIRHLIFLEKFDIKHLFDIDIKELNDKEKVKKMFEKFGIKYSKISLEVDKNKNIRPTKITNEDLFEANELIRIIPENITKNIAEKYNLKKRLINI